MSSEKRNRMFPDLNLHHEFVFLTTPKPHQPTKYHIEMKWPTNFLFCLFFCSLPLTQIFSQKQIILDVPPEDSLVTYRLADLDVLYGLPGDTVPGHPYYTFTWLFGDGTFINGTRDSVVSHVYTLDNRLNYHLGDSNTVGPEVVVYAIGNYSDGTRPPRSPMAPPGDPFRSPEVLEGSFPLGQLGNPDSTSEASFTSVIAGNDLVRLQLSAEVKPQDTMLAILSFRQPGKLPEQPIQGQVFLFYNSAVESDTKVAQKAKGEFQNASPPLSAPPFSHGRSELMRSFVQFTNTFEAGHGSVKGRGIAGFNNVAVFNYGGLESEGQDERHLFLEMVNDSSMWALFKDGQKASLDFLAVMTAIDSSPDVLGQLPDAVVSDTAINNLLSSTFYNDNAFIPVSSNGPFVKVVGTAELTSEIVSAHDPNSLTLYTCECPDSNQQKVVGLIDFSNDGSAPTTQLSITLKIPEQLNINSLNSVDLTPAPEFVTAPSIDFTARTATWTWPALLQPAETVGMGNPSTQGQITFSITLKEGAELSDLSPMDACIVFDQNPPMYTPLVTAAEVITTNTGDETGELLKCQRCEDYTPESGTASGIDWWCALLWVLGISLVIVFVAIVRRFMG